MSNIEIDQSGLAECILASCSKRAQPGGVYCAAHAMEHQPQPGVIEPEVEARVAALADPEPRVYTGPDPDTVETTSSGIPTDAVRRPLLVSQGEADLFYLVTACRGEHGRITETMAQAMVQAMVAGLRAL